MLAVTELKLLTPGKGLRDIHMDVLRGLQIDQDQRPQHGMDQRKAGHEP